jgi:hypothetical protein
MVNDEPGSSLDPGFGDCQATFPEPENFGFNPFLIKSFLAFLMLIPLTSGIIT